MIAQVGGRDGSKPMLGSSSPKTVELLEESLESSPKIFKLSASISQSAHEAWEMRNNCSRHLVRIHEVKRLQPAPIDKEVVGDARSRLVVDEEIPFRVSEMVQAVSNAITEPANVWQRFVGSVSVGDVKGWVDIAESVVEVR